MPYVFDPFIGNFVPQSAGGGGGGVSSVSGTANRITSTGGFTPVIDISAAYVGQSSITTLGTITTGVWNGTKVSEAYGGTNQSTYSTGDTLYASAANTLSKLAAGSNGQVLTLAAGVPSWATPTTGTVTSVSGTTNRITSTGGATPVIDISASYVGQSSITTLGTITTGVWNASVIPLAYGGTNANLTASNGGIFYSTASAGAILSGTATARQMLQSGASTAPAWSTNTWPATTTTGDVIYGSATNVNTNLAIDTYKGSPLSVGSSGLPVYLSPRNYSYYFTDFLIGAVGSEWALASANSGALLFNSNVALTNPGVVSASTATNTNGAAALVQTTNSGTIGPYVLGGGESTFVWYSKLSTLSDGTDTYIARIGLSDVNSSLTTYANGMWFEYTHGTNSGNWQIITSSSSTTTTNNTSNAADTNYHRFKIVVNAAATSVSFFIDDSEVANSPITTNIPTVSTGIKAMASITKSAGTSSRRIQNDYYTSFIALTTSR